MRKRKQNNLKLLVVFDTSTIHTVHEYELVHANAEKLVLENSNHPDLDVFWYLPQMVIDERRYQMNQRAKGLVPYVQRFEKLIGKVLDVGSGPLTSHVDKVIEKSIDELGLKVIQLETANVDWSDIIARSVNRMPPFNTGKNEKGFRDAIIGQCVRQLQETPSHDLRPFRIALVSGDKRLVEYVEDLTSDSGNVSILSNTDAVEGLINTLISELPEEVVEDLTKQASRKFFVEDRNDGFYFTEKIREKISSEFSSHLEGTILDDHHRENGTWYISDPVFLKKEGKRISWMVSVDPEFKVYHFEYDDELRGPSGRPEEKTRLMSDAREEGLARVDQDPLIGQAPALGGLFGLGGTGPLRSRRRVVDLAGSVQFAVYFSANLLKSKKLGKLKFERIEFLGYDFDIE